MSSFGGGPLETRGGWLGGGGGAARLQVRSRVVLITALAVSVAVILVAASAYVVFRHDLFDTVDGTLTSQAETLNNARTHGGLHAASISCLARHPCSPTNPLNRSSKPMDWSSLPHAAQLSFP